jgi:hypothetical protein
MWEKKWNKNCHSWSIEIYSQILSGQRGSDTWDVSINPSRLLFFRLNLFFILFIFLLKSLFFFFFVSIQPRQSCCSKRCSSKIYNFCFWIVSFPKLFNIFFFFWIVTLLEIIVVLSKIEEGFMFVRTLLWTLERSWGQLSQFELLTLPRPF